MSVIVFIHRLCEEDQQQWLERLKLLLPNEEIVPSQQLSQSQIELVEIAIVADPDPKVLEQYVSLIWVQSLWAGVEKLVDSFRLLNQQRACDDKPGIQLVRLIDPQLATTMAEAALAWTLYLHRHIPEYMQQQREKLWRPLHCPTAGEVRVSIMGSGELGMAAIRALVNQGYQVNGWSRSAKSVAGVQHFSGYCQLPDLLKVTDVLICLLPLTAESRGLLNADAFEHLPKGAKLINFARGGIINHLDLQKYLASGHLAHAVLDVFEQEPLTPDSPLWDDPKISILPHISAATNLDSASLIAANNILGYRAQGAIPQAVDLGRGY